VRYAFLVGGWSKVGLGLKAEAETAIGFAIGGEDEVAGEHLQKLSGAILVVFVSLVLPAELVGVGDKVVDAMLLGCSFVCGEGPVIDGDEAAEGAVGGLDYVFFPEVTSGANGALLGDVEVVWPALSGSDLVGGYLLDQGGLLRPGGGGKEKERDGDSCKLRWQT
jgi:hypothetical protein